LGLDEVNDISNDGDGGMKSSEVRPFDIWALRAVRDLDVLDIHFLRLVNWAPGMSLAGEVNEPAVVANEVPVTSVSAVLYMTTCFTYASSSGHSRYKPCINSTVIYQ
jgi:hypothetical protein